MYLGCEADASRWRLEMYGGMLLGLIPHEGVRYVNGKVRAAGEIKFCLC